MKRNARYWALTLAVVLLLGACDWSQARFDDALTAFNPYEPALTASSVQHLKPAWSTSADAGQYVVAGGVIYTTATGPDTVPNRAQALSVSDGGALWTTTVPHGNSPLAVGNGLVYYSGEGGTVALDTASGAPRWSIPQFFATLDGQRAFAVSAFYSGTGGSAQLVAVDAGGQTLWSATTSGEVTGVVVQGGRLVVVTFTKLDNPPHGVILITSYDEGSGAILRRVSVAARDASGNVNPPANQLVSGSSLVYFATSDDVFAADPSSGAVAWHVAPRVVEGLALTAHALVVTSDNTTTQVMAFDPTTGAALWGTNPVGSVAAPRVAGNLLFVGHIQSNPSIGLLIYDVTNGTLVASSTTVCCGPIPSEGHVFVGGLNGLPFQALVPS